VSAELGICSVLADQNNHAAVGPAWCQAVKALSPRITFVRCEIAASRSGHVDTALIARGLHAWRDVGLEVRAVLSLNLGPLATQNPNADLHWKGDWFKSPFIDAWTNNAIQILTELGAIAPEKIWIANEMNLMAAANPLGTGQVLPPLAMGGVADPTKPSALSPEVAWSLTYHAALWIKRQCPRVTVVYPAALSILVSFLTSQHDSWVEEWTNQGNQYLYDHGVRPALPWDGMTANLEGLMTESYSRYTAEGLRQHMTDWGITGPLVVGEWGVPHSMPGRPLDTVAMQEAVAALARHFDSMAFFAAHVSDNYGIWPMRFVAGEIVPGEPTDWITALPPMLEGLP
jgi:hypothetical protein